MKLWQEIGAGLALTVAATAASATCPSLAVYRVSNISTAPGADSLAIIGSRLVAGTAWTVNATPEASSVHLSLSGVGGPLDKVLGAVVAKAQSADYTVSQMQDPVACVVHLNVAKIAPAPTPLPVARVRIEPRPATTMALTSMAPRRAERATAATAETYVIPAGTLLSRGLSDYVKRFDWSLRWQITDDYRLDAPLPIPAGSMRDGVNYVVRAYQSWGGLIGDVPNYANPNKVVVIQPVTAAKDSH